MSNVLADLRLNISTNTANLTKGVEEYKKRVSDMKSATTNSLSTLKTNFKSASDNIKSSLNVMTGGFSGMLSAGVSAFTGLAKSAKTASAAFAATGIGAIIIGITTALAGLIAYFKKTGEGEDKLAEATAYLKGIFEGIIKVLVDVGKWLIKAFEDPKSAILELWEVIKQNLVNRFKGIVDLFAAGWSAIKNGAIGVGLAIKGIFDNEAREKSKEYFDAMVEDLVKVGKAAIQASTGITPEALQEFAKGIKENAEAMKSLEQQEDAFQDRRRKWNLEAKDLEYKLEEARLAAAEQEDTSLEGKKKKLDLINSAIEYQKQITAGNLAIASTEIDLEKQRISLTGDLNDMTDDQADKLNSLQVAYKGLEVEGKSSLVKLTKQSQALAEQTTLAMRAADAPQTIKPITAQIDNTAFDNETSHIKTVEEMYAAAEKNKQKWAKETADYIKQLDDEKLQRDLENTGFGLEMAAQAITALGDFQEAAMNRELEAAGGNAAKKDEIRKKYDKKQKNVAIMQAVIAGALAVVQAFAQLGPIGGAISAVLIGATTAAQIAKISSQPLAKGGLAYGETLATIGEYTGASMNPEVVTPLKTLDRKLSNTISAELAKLSFGYGPSEVKFVQEYDQLVGVLTTGSKIRVLG